MLTLHHLPGSRSCRVRWLLEELGLDYTLRTYGFGDGALRSEAYRKRHPLGRVPVLEDDDLVLFESGAIVEWLLERYGEGRLTPPPGTPARARCLQWAHFGEATLMPPIVSINANRFVLPPADRSEVALSVARRQLRRVLGVLGDAVAGREALVDDAFSFADVMVGYGVVLARSVGELPEAEGATLARWLGALEARPAFARAFEGGFGG